MIPGTDNHREKVAHLLPSLTLPVAEFVRDNQIEIFRLP